MGKTLYIEIYFKKSLHVKTEKRREKGKKIHGEHNVCKMQNITLQDGGLVLCLTHACSYPFMKNLKVHLLSFLSFSIFFIQDDK